MLARPGAGPSAVAISALTGKPGVGKSALAIHLAHRLAPRFPDAQLYVNLRGAEPERLHMAEVLAGFLRALGVAGDTIPPEIEERARLYRAQLADRKALVVLDNAHDEPQVRPLLPGSPSCAALTTSRSPLGGLDGARLRPLDVIDRLAAVELLGKLAGEQRIAAESQAADTVADLCGDLPLAVRIAGGLLAEKPAWSVAKLAGRLEDERGRLHELQLGDRDVRASFMISYRELTPEDARLFRRLALLIGPDFGAGVVAAVDDTTPETAERALDHLVDAQLVEAPAENRYRFHDLLRLFARERLHSDETTEDRDLGAARARRWHVETAAIADRLLGPLDQVQHIIGADIDPEAARAWALSWFEAERHNVVATIEEAHTANDWETTQRLAASIAAFFRLRTHWDEWQHTHELALKAARSAHNRHGEAQTRGSLGVVYGEQGRWEDAIGCYEQTLTTMRELGDRHGEAQTLGSLGLVYGEQGRWEDAIGCYEQALTTMRELGDRHGEAQTLGSLGLVYGEQGRWEDAIGCYEQALTTMRELGDRHGEAQTLGSLGLVYGEQGRWEDAIGCYEQALTTMRELGDRHGEAQTLGNLGLVYGEQGRWEDAIGCYEQALTTMRELGDRHGEAQTLGSLGLVYGEQGRWEDAIGCYEQALTTMRELGDRHGEAHTLANLGLALRTTGRVDDGTAHLRAASAILEELGAAEAEQVRALLAESPKRRWWQRRRGPRRADPPPARHRAPRHPARVGRHGRPQAAGQRPRGRRVQPLRRR